MQKPAAARYGAPMRYPMLFGVCVGVPCSQTLVMLEELGSNLSRALRTQINAVGRFGVAAQALSARPVDQAERGALGDLAFAGGDCFPWFAQEHRTRCPVQIFPGTKRGEHKFVGSECSGDPQLDLVVVQNDQTLVGAPCSKNAPQRSACDLL